MHAKQSSKELGTFRIGTIFPLSGRLKAHGMEANIGIHLALEKVKRDDPQLAKHIELIQEDDLSTSNGAKNASKQLLSKRASILIGSITNIASEGIVEVAHQAKKPLIVPTSSSLNLGANSPYVFKSNYASRWQGHLLAQFARYKLGKLEAALLFDPKNSYSYDISQKFINSYKSFGGSILTTQRYNIGKTAKFQIEQALKNIVKSQPDFILFPTPSTQEAKIAMEYLDKIEAKIAILGPDSWHRQSLWRNKNNRKAITGHFYSLAFAPSENNAAARQFTNAFKSQTNRYPSAVAAMAYDSLLLAVHAFKEAQTDNAQRLVAALKNARQVEGLLGLISINENQSAEKAGIIMETTLNGARFHSLIKPNATKVKVKR